MFLPELFHLLKVTMLFTDRNSRRIEELDDEGWIYMMCRFSWMSQATRMLLTELNEAKISPFGGRLIALRLSKLRFYCGKSVTFI
jgi:hypothetical protein